ncbi:hypothetical protein RintRC_5973 [Richelia intracellularis]|nr:hypothetical protein RintRC_5973 [Richelia intracellularis]
MSTIYQWFQTLIHPALIQRRTRKLFRFGFLNKAGILLPLPNVHLPPAYF